MQEHPSHGVYGTRMDKLRKRVVWAFFFFFFPSAGACAVVGEQGWDGAGEICPPSVPIETSDPLCVCFFLRPLLFLFQGMRALLHFQTRDGRFSSSLSPRPQIKRIGKTKTRKGEKGKEKMSSNNRGRKEKGEK